MTAKIKDPRDRISHQKYVPKGVRLPAFERVYWPYLPLLAVIGILFIFSAKSGAITANLDNPGNSRVLAYAVSTDSARLLAATNEQRVANGLQPLRFNSKLNAAAYAKAKDMADRNYWSHNTPDGQLPWIFVESFGYAYQKLGENLAAGFANEELSVKGWMASPPHRQNVLDPSYYEVGFGFANNPTFTAAGGSPATITVAFYGQPTGLAAAETPPAENDAQPANTETAVAPAATAISPAQLALSDFYISRFGTVIAIGALSIIAVTWASRHLFAIRRAVVHGEKFVVRHPLVDISLILIVALLFIVSRSSGFVQ
ncbi:MAG: CAP domain-containing protein [Candidatus Saccharimonadales bacterium]